jgi:hypothetical protein
MSACDVGDVSLELFTSVLSFALAMSDKGWRRWERGGRMRTLWCSGGVW